MRIATVAITASLGLAAAAPASAAVAEHARDFIFTDAEGHMVLRFAGVASTAGLSDDQIDEIVNVQLSTMVHDRLRADARFDLEPVDEAWAEPMEARLERHVRQAAPELAAVDAACRSASCRLVFEHPRALPVTEHQALMDRIQRVLQAFNEAHPGSFEAVFLMAGQYQEPAKPFTKVFLRRAGEELTRSAAR
ncbi:MAG TPA: hypothetical protein VF322_18005 [Gammaproteobacteria bacterium]